MDANSTDINRLKVSISKFSGILSKGLSLPHQKFFKQVVYGIQASKDVKVSNISRSLKEPIQLIKTENRLCNHFKNNDFTAHINETILRLAKEKISDDMIIAIDPGDIMKPYAKDMEHLCGIYDGSEGKSATGYHLIQVTGANLEHNKIVPMYCEAYSTSEDGYEVQSKKITKIIDKVVEYTDKKGTWTIDRAGDNNELIKHFTNKNLKFVTRLKLNRWLNFYNKNNALRTIQTERIDRHIELPFQTKFTTIDENKTKELILQFGAVKVWIDDENQKLTSIIIKGFGAKPMILLTNHDIDTTSDKEIYHCLEMYLTRWKCDECFRYIKQSYNLEDVRVMSYNGVRNMVAFVHAIAYFTSIWIGFNSKLRIMKEKIFIVSKRFFAVPNFFTYALADGIFDMLKLARVGIDKYLGKRGQNFKDFQLSLFPDFNSS